MARDELGKPEQAIKEIKEKRKQEKKRLKEQTNRLSDEIKGNPNVIEAIRRLERRLELLEEKVD